MRSAFVIALLGALFVVDGCGREAPKSPLPRPSGEKEWSEEEMATDPEGYLKWADAQLGSQIKERQDRLGGLAGKQKEIVERRKSFVGDYSEIENLENLLGTATRKAEEEDGWPVSLAGKSFTKEQADGILADIRKYLADRKSVASAYDSALSKLDAAEKSLRDDLQRLTTLREKVGADLVAVKAAGTMPEVEKLRRTEAEIAHYTKVLAPDAEVNVQNLPKPKAPPASLQSIIK